LTMAFGGWGGCLRFWGVVIVTYGLNGLRHRSGNSAPLRLQAGKKEAD